MNITPYRAYQAGVNKVNAVEKKSFYAAMSAAAEEGRQPVQPAEQNVDRLDISGGAQRSEVEKSARALTQQASRPASAQRIEALRSAVQNKAYAVPAERIADAMVTSWRLL